MTAAERASLSWYAHEILLTARVHAMSRAGGYVDAAFNSLWDLATLAAEARMIEYNLCNASEGAAQARASAERQQVEQQHAAWRAQASEFWAERPSRNQTAVARKIDPDPKKRRNIIRVVCDLDPRKRK